MATDATKTALVQLYVAEFGRAPDLTDYAYWLALLDQGVVTLAQTANLMYQDPAARAYYPLSLSDAEVVTSFYANVLHLVPDTADLNYWASELSSGHATKAMVFTQLITIHSAYSGADPALLQAKQFLNNRVEVARYYAEHSIDPAFTQQVISGVTADYATVGVAKAAIDGGSMATLGIPLIASASYDAATGVLVVTGSGFLDQMGAANDIVANKLTLSGEGGQYTFTDSSNVEITSSTSFTLALSATDKAALGLILNNNGLASTGGATYNLAAADNWDAGALASLSIADLTGNGITVSGVDMPPTASIVVTDTALKAGETSAVTITFSEAVAGFTNADLTIANGTLSSVSSSDGGVTWTATLTPTTSVTGATNAITLDNTGVTDAAGNAGTGTTDSNNYAIDTTRPTASIAVADTALAVGETSTVTITFNEAVIGLTNADLTVANGTLSTISSSDGGVTWTATLTPTASTTDATNVITLDNTGVIDAMGNAGTGTTNSNNYAVGMVRPTASIAVTDTGLLAGETSAVTITFSEAVAGFANADLTIANGTLSNVSSSDGGVTWTATLTPTASTTDATNAITLDNTGVTNAAGNTGSGSTDSNNYTLDTARPTAAIAVADMALAAGETSAVTITFSEAVTGFTNADLAIANGTLSSVSSSDGGVTWTATLTPTASITDPTNVITLDNTGVTDAAGNAGSGTSDSNNYAVDMVAPTLGITSGTAAVKTGETATITFTFSEAPVGFAASDVATSGGILAGLAPTGDPLVYTATFTPTAGTASGSASITVAGASYGDVAGNGGGAGTTPAVAIDTLAPVFVAAAADGNTLVMTYAEFSTLSALQVAPASAFGVVAGGAANAATAVVVNAAAKTVTLTLAGAIAFGQIVTVAYTDPSAGDDANAVQDLAGNDVASFAATPVTNLTAAPPVPPVLVNTPGSGAAIAADAPSGRSLQQGDTLTAQTQALVDPDGLGAIGYQWLRDGNPVTGASGASYLLTADDVGASMAVVASYTDGRRFQEHVLSPATQPIADNDGVSGALEAQAPPLVAGGVLGDGNGDGLLDELQVSVTSAPLPGTAGYLTLVADGDQPVISDFRLDSAPLDWQETLLVWGLLHFNVDVGATGLSEAFSVFVDSGTNATGYWLQDSSGAWSNVATAVQAVGSKIRIDFAITDGGQFDLDGQANGAIESSGGVASMRLGLLGLAPDLDASGGFWF